MINKKIGKIIGPVAGAMLFIATISIMPVKAYAAETQILQNSTSNIENENKSYETEQNGTKFKVSDIVGTRNRIKLNATITREDGMEELDNHRNVEFRMYMENVDENSSGTSWDSTDSKTLEIKKEMESEQGFPEKGIIRADLVMGEYDFNGSLVIPVDFTESFKQYVEKKLDVGVDNDTKITGFESDIIGTRVIVRKSVEDDERYGGYYDGKMDPIFIIKVGNKIYCAENMSGYSYGDDDVYYTCSFDTEALTYNDIKDAEEISIIPVKCNLTYDEIRKKYNKDSYYEEMQNKKIVTDNVKYNKDIEFADGTKGSIKVERTGGNINIYCSSDSDINSFIAALGINGVFADETYDSVYFEENKTIFKDENQENQYVVQIKDSHPDMTCEVDMSVIYLFADKYELDDEIKIN